MYVCNVISQTSLVMNLEEESEDAIHTYTPASRNGSSMLSSANSELEHIHTQFVEKSRIVVKVFFS